MTISPSQNAVIQNPLDSSSPNQSALVKEGTEVVLEAEGLGRSYDDFEVLRDVNLKVTQGEIVSILGLSGSGKTTLFNLLAGLDRPDTGKVVSQVKIGYMMQKDLLLPWKKVWANIALPLTLVKVSKREAKATVTKHLERFGLSGLEERWPFQLSGGQRQRAALLRTWLYGGKIWLLDEPFSGLDAITREDMQHWLKSIIAELGLTVLLVTHDVEEALALSDRVYVLCAGHPTTLHPAVDISTQQNNSAAQIRKLLYTDALGRDVRRGQTSKMEGETDESI